MLFTPNGFVLARESLSEDKNFATCLLRKLIVYKKPNFNQLYFNLHGTSHFETACLDASSAYYPIVLNSSRCLLVPQVSFDVFLLLVFFIRNMRLRLC